MNKVININFQGRVLPIEEHAYEILKQYIDSLRKYFSKEEGCDEIINDIECRIAELCDERLKKGEVCITDATINLIIASIGRPEDFDAQEEHFESQSSTGQSTETFTQDSNTNEHKRLYRDAKNKVFGGVCAGIANYFNTDPIVVRLLWIFIPGLNFIAYLILWVAIPASTVKEVGGQRKRFFRDVENKVIGGVCSGLSKFFGIRVGIIRLIFLLPLIRLMFRWSHFHLFQFWDAPDFPSFIAYSFSPGAVFIYIVLWLVIPEAKTSADKLEMVGEKVDLNSIKNTIQKDMEGFSDRAKAWGEQIKNRNDENETGFFHFIMKLIRIFVKIIVYFVLGLITIIVLSSLFGVGVAATGLLPLKAFVLDDSQQWMAVAIIVLFIWVPVVGIVTVVIRKLIGAKKANVWVRTSFWALWVLGWIIIPFFLASLSKSFSKHNTATEQILTLNNPTVDYLEVTAQTKAKYYDEKWFEIEPFKGMYDEDTLYVRNVRVRIVQSKNDSFSIKYVKLAKGATVQEADQIANKINFAPTQEDSLLYLDKGIAINKTDKFRNQHIIMTIAVPIGKRIKINNRGWRHTNIQVDGHHISDGSIGFGISDNNDWYDEWGDRWDNETYSFERGVEYKMTATGLEKLRRDADAEEEHNSDVKEEKDDIKSELEDLKRQREELEQKLKDKETKGKTSSTSSALKIVPKVAERVEEARWLVERFTH
jgi:phage shock protein PspC (stress-responsive transcriptional regulator)/heme/copper-type cytochrome/quinol oxidase subunit 2